MNRVAICWHPWQNNSHIRSHTGEGHLWHLYRVMKARVERAGTYLASRDVDSGAFEAVGRIQQGETGSAESRKECWWQRGRGRFSASP